MITAVALRVVERMSAELAPQDRKRCIVVDHCAPAGDRRGLPGAVVADLLRGEGFEVIDLGARCARDVAFAEAAQAAAQLAVAVVVGVTTPGRDECWGGPSCRPSSVRAARCGRTSSGAASRRRRGKGAQHWRAEAGA